MGEGYSLSPLPPPSLIFALECFFIKFNAESKRHDFVLSCFDYPAAEVCWFSARVVWPKTFPVPETTNQIQSIARRLTEQLFIFDIFT